VIFTMVWGLMVSDTVLLPPPTVQKGTGVGMEAIGGMETRRAYAPAQ